MKQHAGTLTSLPSPLRLFFTVLAIIVLAEAAVMILLQVLLPGVLTIATSIADASLVALLSASFLWWIIVRPLQSTAMAETALREEAQRLRQEADAFAEIGRDLASSLELKAILQKILEHARVLCQVDLAYIGLYDPAEGAATIVAFLGASTNFSKHPKIFPGKGIGGKVLETGEPFVTEDYLHDPRISPDYRDMAGAEGVRANLAIPITREGRLLGLLWVANRDARPFTPRDQAILTKLATQAAIALENARLHEQVKRQAEALERTVEERTRELQVANARLEEASRHKSEFLAHMSHELRTPLNSIIGFSEVLEDQTFGSLNEKQARYVDNIHKSGMHLLALINDILDLSKVEAGKLELHPEAFDLRDTLEAALTDIQPQAEAKGLTLELQLREGLSTVVADPVRVKQILYNLLSNAVKFTPDGGTVRVTAHRVTSDQLPVTSERQGAGRWPLATHGEFVEIAVTDTGIGIKPEDLARLFQPFTQLEAPLAKQHQGTGLGLALTKKLVERQGGRIWVESEGEGKGSTFTFLLPWEGQEARG